MCGSAAAGQDPGSERGDAAGGVRAVPGQDGRGDHAGGAGDARGAPEGHHGIHDGGGEWSERNSNIGGLIQNPKCPANRVSRNRKTVETERRKPTPLYSPDALGGYQGNSSARYTGNSISLRAR